MTFYGIWLVKFLHFKHADRIEAHQGRTFAKFQAVKVALNRIGWEILPLGLNKKCSKHPLWEKGSPSLAKPSHSKRNLCT